MTVKVMAPTDACEFVSPSATGYLPVLLANVISGRPGVRAGQTAGSAGTSLPETDCTTRMTWVE